MGVPNEKLRVITEDVGGAFGMKTPPYPEYPALLVAAKNSAGRCNGSRRASEASSPTRRRATPSPEVALALDDKGKFLALKMRHLCNQGAYVSTAGVRYNTNNFARCLPACYRIPKVDASVACYFSNPFRSPLIAAPERPEANYALERASKEAARIIGMDPVRCARKI